MESTVRSSGGSETLARGTELAVYQCGHGLLHLRVNRVTLTLKAGRVRPARDGCG